MKKNIVIKIGGSLLTNDKLLDELSKEIWTLKNLGHHIIVVHGGGKHISKALESENIQSHFYKGYRITTEKEIDIIANVLCHQVNKKIVMSLMKYSLKAIGIKSTDKPYIKAESKIIDGHNMSHVGAIVDFDEATINYLQNNDYIPVIASIGLGDDKQLFNINADEVAGYIGHHMATDYLVFMTDVVGILLHGVKIQTFSETAIQAYLTNDLLKGGMVPKVESCLYGLSGQTKQVYIIKGQAGLLTDVLNGKAVGTKIVRSNSYESCTRNI